MTPVPGMSTTISEVSRKLSVIMEQKLLRLLHSLLGLSAHAHDRWEYASRWRHQLRIPDDLPEMLIRVLKVACIAAPEGLLRWLDNACSCAPGLLHHGINLGSGGDIMSKGDVGRI